MGIPFHKPKPFGVYANPWSLLFIVLQDSCILSLFAPCPSESVNVLFLPIIIMILACRDGLRSGMAYWASEPGPCRRGCCCWDRSASPSLATNSYKQPLQIRGSTSFLSSRQLSMLYPVVLWYRQYRPWLCLASLFFWTAGLRNASLSLVCMNTSSSVIFNGWYS